ncbi:MAG TPA: OsmC family peroxiredoxin [Intrasporangium sp.]|uniref:OsmC family peroxiredoxin n=1 Tax=Intrasporangium sp. TaxID=1925024 RepID=UPI002B47A0DB|nr:OsmC family peroxiredoxin [Intrasporangium sp.]HKX68234.1 OsmC family peroxiredoxin [Intrasporangium sp.]
MSATRTASAHWEGDLFTGSGQVSLESSGIGTYDVSWPARTEEPGGKTSPEELIAAAHSACYNMAFSNVLAKAGQAPTTLDTTAAVTFVPGTGITEIKLSTVGSVPGLSAEDFQRMAEEAKDACPVSQALKAVPSITVESRLAS